MKSNPVAEIAHEHHGLEFATHTAFLCCSARLKTVSWAESHWPEDVFVETATFSQN